MTDPGFVVTIRDVYDKVTGLNESIESISRSQSTEVALLKQRMGQAEDDIKEGRKEREEDRRLRINIKWQMAGVIVAALLAPIVTYILVHH